MCENLTIIIKIYSKDVENKFNINLNSYSLSRIHRTINLINRKFLLRLKNLINKKKLYIE